MSYMYICPECSKVFKVKGTGKKARCTKCNDSYLVDMQISDEEWDAMSEPNKKRIKNQVLSEISNTSELVSENISDSTDITVSNGNDNNLKPVMYGGTVNETIERLQTFISPLSQFEKLVESEDKIKRKYASKKSSKSVIRALIVIAAVLISNIAFYILNLEVLIYNSPFFAKYLCMLMLALPILYFVGYFLLLSKREKEEFDIAEKNEIQAIKDQEIYVISPYIDEIREFVPPSYQYSYAVERFCEYFRNGRVGNMQEAVNLYEEEQHRLQMQHMQNQLIEQQRRQNTLMAVTAVASVATAVSAASAASSLSSIRDNL